MREYIIQSTNSWLKSQLLLFCFLISFLTNLYAIEIALYQVELPTQNQAGSFDQTQLMKQALKTLLIRVSGSEQFLNKPEITAALANVDSYIKQFSYHQNAASEKTIKVLFHEKKINTLLNSVKQSIWQKNRPLVLVWLVGEKENSETVNISSEMEKILNQRGIPFVFPLLDLTDTTAVSKETLLGESITSIEQAAKRYNPDVILVGHVVQQNDIWQAHWRIVNKGEKADWHHSASTLNLTLNEAANMLTQKLKGGDIKIAKTEPLDNVSVPNRITLTVSGNLDVQQYNKILEYLRRLPDVSEAEVAQIMPDKTLFDLITTQSKEMLIQAISDGHLLTKISPPESLEGSTSAAEETLIYEVASGVS